MKQLTIAPLPGAHLRAEVNRSRVAADLRARRASIGIWFFLSIAVAAAGAAFVNQLALIEAAAKCAAGV